MDELSLDDLLGALEDVQQQKSTVRHLTLLYSNCNVRSLFWNPPAPPSFYHWRPSPTAFHKHPHGP